MGCGVRDPPNAKTIKKKKKIFYIHRVICQAFDKVPMVPMPVDMVSLVPGML